MTRLQQMQAQLKLDGGVDFYDAELDAIFTALEQASEIETGCRIDGYDYRGIKVERLQNLDVALAPFRRQV